MLFLLLFSLVFEGPLEGVATYYTYDTYGGNVLYCDRGEGLTYELSTIPWVAVDVALYQSGWVKCWDILLVEFEDGYVIARALDAGPFSKYYVADFPDKPILVDFPEHLWPLETMSAEIRVYNLSAKDRDSE